MAGIYIHIPFCRSKCAYCDFYSSASAANYDEYVEALSRELIARCGEINEKPRTLYLGGGTPSMLPMPLLDKLLRRVGDIYPLDRMEEITLEANPEDITAESIAAYRGMGINRISIGIQSFSDEALRRIGRQHSARDSRMALDALAKSGINYSADLIYGLPDQTIAQWREELKELIDRRPYHFSAYLLSYEPGTRIYAQLNKGMVEEASEQLAEEMYAALCQYSATEGYEHYEISNFSLPGYHSRHNSAYWDYTPYLGLGAAAHSFDGTLRRINPASIKKYLKEVETSGHAFTIEDESAENRLNDYIITSLRTKQGLRTDLVGRLFGSKLLAEVESSALKEESIGNLKPTPSGWAIPEQKWLTADAILRNLIV